ncbi:ArsR family transcriptional regulator [Candidatus Thorarchaeota archaeon]|nr:MAG: ArsR family transcriptional regulator [Candidatus Thorarchaeota archaeon]
MSYDRRAFLMWIRNVDSGLRSRTAILGVIEEKESPTTSQIAEEMKISYSTVLYHLKNMEREEVVEKDVNSGAWHVVDQGQAQLVDFA